MGLKVSNGAHVQRHQTLQQELKRALATVLMCETSALTPAVLTTS